MEQIIPSSIKRECVKRSFNGETTRSIYNNYFKKNISGSNTTLRGFQASMSKWKKRYKNELELLDCGTIPNFSPHSATVQINSNGDVTQMWVKQHPDAIDPELFLDAVRDVVPRYEFVASEYAYSDRMLEIPLFDMHWGISYFEDYRKELDDILLIIESNYWDEIIIPVGQDLFHNDSIAKGVTTKGTPIEKVDMIKAVKDASRFMFTIIDYSLANSNKVKVVYSPGNHDRTVGWMFAQVLLQRYGPEVVDDELKFRKVFSYGSNAIMVTHGESKRAASKSNLAHMFAVEFPKEFSESTTREIHTGHLHEECSGDVFGVMVRRLSSKNKNDEWSDYNDYIGTNKRFMLFEYDTKALRSVHYI